ncbi:hypothetical protein PPYR_15540 [Photinus pyralis]|uniref:Myb/SANT-like DNA-binding domain-containing protein n=1 Tax=Photinus pyralis TaxID=7054 RepID=A0A5N3ZYJ1_PHOPY|nr:hypothetical protein PPYR_15540 [Photinus pyralis]
MFAEEPTNNDSGCKWTERGVKLLLELYREKLEMFRSSKKTNKSIWALIAKTFCEKGMSVTGDQCDLKFRNLKKTYKRIKDSNSKTGRGTYSWPYFTIFEEMFATDADVNPLCIASSSSGVTHSDDVSGESSRASSRSDDVASNTPASSKKTEFRFII